MPNSVTLVSIGVASAAWLTVHVVLAIVTLRFLRIRLSTRWAPYIYVVVLVPLIYFPTTVLFGTLLGTLMEIDRGVLFGVFWAVPLMVGISIDVFWLPHPADIAAEGQ
ncbi:MAG: hypothetical protein ABEI52_13245 [Halobacteriaceae archaeon]